LILVIDGQGESASTSLMLGDMTGIRPLVDLPVTSSMGILYAAATAFLGFEPIEDEYKIMGLAAYGENDEYRAFFDQIVKTGAEGRFSIPCLLESPGRRVLDWSEHLGPPRLSHKPIEQRHIAIAYSLQKALERSVLGLLQAHEEKLKTRHLCLAGGVALNCSMNGVIDRTRLFDELYVQPAANDPGAALGAALVSYHEENPSHRFSRIEDTYFGPSYDLSQVDRALSEFQTRISWVQCEDYLERTAGLLSVGRVIGFFQGRMEFGPRALGNRSILADPRRADMKDRVNKAVKKREEFRPFAPSVAAEAAKDFFELPSKQGQYEFMTVAVKARPERSREIPAVVHVNGTARVQVVRREVNPNYWKLLSAFGRLTGVPVLMNTSFNIKGEPIVCTPEDAIRCFLGTEIDHLVFEARIVSKK
jgi:carbamoyltransferase